MRAIHSCVMYRRRIPCGKTSCGQTRRASSSHLQGRQGRDTLEQPFRQGGEVVGSQAPLDVAREQGTSRGEMTA